MVSKQGGLGCRKPFSDPGERLGLGLGWGWWVVNDFFFQLILKKMGFGVSVLFSLLSFLLVLAHFSYSEGLVCMVGIELIDGMCAWEADMDVDVNVDVGMSEVFASGGQGRLVMQAVCCFVSKYVGFLFGKRGRGW